MDLLSKVGIEGMLKSVFLKGKGEMKMSKKIIGGLCVLVFAVGIGYAALDETVSVLVTPGGVEASLLATPDSFNFGTVNLAASSAPVHGISLENNGSGGCTITKQITTELTGWTAIATDPTGLDNQYRLQIGTGTTPGVDSFHANCILGVITNETTLTDATGGAGGGVLVPDASVDVVFHIEMPLNTGVGGEKSGVVTFTATTE